jgi:crossover junction endodeoxyribonuclease RuvC
MKILGIDPGLTRCGYGVVEKLGPRQLKFLAVGVATSSPQDQLEARIGKLADEVAGVIALHQPAVIALERVFAQSNLPSVMGVAQISGVVLHLAHQAGIPVVWHTPTAVKAAVTGSGRAGKDQVGFMVAKILSLPEVPKPADAADSLAIAICEAWSSSVSSTADRSTTSAQQKWLAAEAKAKQTKR